MTMLLNNERSQYFTKQGRKTSIEVWRIKRFFDNEHNLFCFVGISYMFPNELSLIFFKLSILISI